jgi:hypothetical protein
MTSGPRSLNSPEGTEAFQWALVRVVPRVERGEAINVGVIVYSKRLRYLAARIELDEARLRALAPTADIGAVHGALTAFRRACTEGPERTISERFNWLTAPRSAMVQPGPVHGGVAADPAGALDRLFTDLVVLLTRLDPTRKPLKPTRDPRTPPGSWSLSESVRGPPDDRPAWE